MKYYAAVQSAIVPETPEEIRKLHLEFLGKLIKEGKVYARGRFLDGTGGLIIYQAESLEEAKEMAEADPFILHKVRRMEVHEWALQTSIS